MNISHHVGIWTISFSLTFFCLLVKANDEIDNLSNLSIAELFNIKVELVSRHEEKLFTTAAAVSVITQEDIRRSGLNTIPDLLRLVPGLHVGKLDSNKWAINSRFESRRFSDTMLVLMDGRTLYTPLFGGVYWDVQDTLLSDIERIEIVRGPGASLWGSNAMTGIINIVTKAPEDSQGGQATVGIGEGDARYLANARYGFEWQDKMARVYLQHRQVDNGRFLNADQSGNNDFFEVGASARDDGYLDQGGFSVDMPHNEGNIRVQGDLYQGVYHDFRTLRRGPVANKIDVEGANIITRWTGTTSDSDDAHFSLQSYLDYTRRVDGSFSEQRVTLDIDFQHDFTFSKQQIVWGAGYRVSKDETKLVSTFALEPKNSSIELYSLFFQDQIELLEETLFFTLGVKAERNDFTGNEYQPNVRLRWSPNDQNTFWMALSRAVSIPARADSDSFLDFNAFFNANNCPFINDPELGCISTGGSALRDESALETFDVLSTEMGYRLYLDRVLIDLALFHEDFSQGLLNSSLIERVYGIETDIRFELTENWSLAFSHAYHRADQLIAGTRARTKFRGIPEHRANIRSYWDINTQWEFDTLLYYVDTASDSATDIPSYIRLDLRLGWHPHSDLEVSLSLTNLLDGNHVEDSDRQRLTTSARRGGFLKINYYF